MKRITPPTLTPFVETLTETPRAPEDRIPPMQKNPPRRLLQNRITATYYITPRFQELFASYNQLSYALTQSPAFAPHAQNELGLGYGINILKRNIGDQEESILSMAMLQSKIDETREKRRSTPWYRLVRIVQLYRRSNKQKTELSNLEKEHKALVEHQTSVLPRLESHLSRLIQKAVQKEWITPDHAKKIRNREAYIPNTAPVNMNQTLYTIHNRAIVRRRVTTQRGAETS